MQSHFSFSCDNNDKISHDNTVGVNPVQTPQISNEYCTNQNNLCSSQESPGEYSGVRSRNKKWRANPH